MFEFIGVQGYWHQVGMPLNLEARTLLDYMATIDAPTATAVGARRHHARLLAAEALSQVLSD